MPLIDYTIRIAELEKAIREHRSQKADDRCIEDDDRLYAVLGDGIVCDRRVGDKVAMMQNCLRFIDKRCEGGTWPTYVELEKKAGDRQKIIDMCFALVMKISEPHWVEHFANMDVMQKAEWVRHNLKACGLEVEPMGMSHGVLKET